MQPGAECDRWDDGGGVPPRAGHHTPVHTTAPAPDNGLGGFEGFKGLVPKNFLLSRGPVSRLPRRAIHTVTARFECAVR